MSEETRFDFVMLSNIRLCQVIAPKMPPMITIAMNCLNCDEKIPTGKIVMFCCEECEIGFEEKYPGLLASRGL